MKWRLVPALVLALALPVQVAALCCLPHGAAQSGSAHPATGHHSSTPRAGGAFEGAPVPCVTAVNPSTALRERARSSTLEVSAPLSAGPVLACLTAFSIVPAVQTDGNPREIPPTPHLPLRL
jgi:hypothetical protein